MPTLLQAQQQLISSLLDPQCYPHPVKKVQLIETHISWVLLAGRFAYKIKKALDLGFLNTLELKDRRTYCVEEIRLNQRLAPHIYLTALAIGGAPDSPELGKEPAIEYAVKMRRFSSHNTLATLIPQHKISAAQIEALAIRLAAFHQSLPVQPTSERHDRIATLQDQFLQSFQQLKEYADQRGLLTLTCLQQELTERLHTCSALLQARLDQGYVRECHGDLHLGNLALIRGQVIPFDGIDFNRELREIDVIDEIAFLFMDLLAHDATALAYRLLNAYLSVTGDYAGLTVFALYCANRALVRAKVIAMQSPFAQQIAVCESYLSLGREFLKRRSPALILMHGLPGTGKSHFARQAAEQLGAICIRSDVERKRLFGLKASESSQTLSQDIYTEEATKRTYHRLKESAGEILSGGYYVIIDAAFLKKSERDEFKELARQTSHKFLIIDVETTAEILHHRIQLRATQRSDASEADLSVLQQLQRIQEPLTEAERDDVFHYRNDETSPIVADHVWVRLRRHLDHLG